MFFKSREMPEEEDIILTLGYQGGLKGEVTLDLSLNGLEVGAHQGTKQEAQVPCTLEHGIWSDGSQGEDRS